MGKQSEPIPYSKLGKDSCFDEDMKIDLLDLLRWSDPHASEKRRHQALAVITELEEAVETYLTDTQHINEEERKLFQRIRVSANDLVSAIDTLSGDAVLALLKLSKGKELKPPNIIRNQIDSLSKLMPAAEKEFTQKGSDPRRLAEKILASRIVKVFTENYEGQLVGSGASLNPDRVRFVKAVFNSAGIETDLHPKTLHRKYIAEPYKRFKNGTSGKP